jgi:hypothetical protein
VDETYVKVAGRWRYVYRAIDQFGQVIDVFVAPRRDAKTARGSFGQAIGTTMRTPVEVVTDKAQMVEGHPRPVLGSAAADRRGCRGARALACRAGPSPQRARLEKFRDSFTFVVKELGTEMIHRWEDDKTSREG